jgi:hypothetical protein
MTRFDDLLRAAAGYDPPARHDQERPVGDVGIGRGGAGGPSPWRRTTTNAQVNERLRSAGQLIRSARVAGGIHLDPGVDLDDVLGGR